MTIGNAGTMVGVVCQPDDPSIERKDTGVIFLNAGLVHRVGPSRMYVRLARRLAERGFVSLRFDFSGIGDSLPRLDNRPFEQSWIDETQEAMDHLERTQGVRRFLLVGICSGAVGSFKAASRDERVRGIVMMNARGFESDARWRGHVESRGWMQDYWRKIFSPASWWRALTGKTQYGRLVIVTFYRFITSIKRPEKHSAVAESLAGQMSDVLWRGVRLLLVVSTGDHSIHYLREIFGERLERLRPRDRVELIEIDGADHTFTQRIHQLRALEAVEQWAVTHSAEELARDVQHRTPTAVPFSSPVRARG